MKKIKLSAILLAGGKGTRLNSPIPKQFLLLNNKEIALYSFNTLIEIEAISEIIVVADQAYHPLFNHSKVKFALPGTRRQDSVYHGLSECHSDSDLVLIHDSARPFITKNLVLNLIDQAVIYDCVISAVPVISTIKQTDSELMVQKTLERSQLWEIHTPQIAKKTVLKQGLETALSKSITLTDDASALELIGAQIKIVLGSYQNIKITTQEDLKIAQCFATNA